VNFTRFSKATSFDFDATLGKIVASAHRFNVDRIKQEDVAKAGGGLADEE
jgi:ParB family chromosome partitioning protein